MEELIREYIGLDSSSPSGLSWIKRLGQRGKLGPISGYVNSFGYLKFKLKGKQLAVHRVVYFLTTGKMTTGVDHIDRDKLNNIPDNLRAATRSLSCHNKSYTGFNFDKKSNKFRVRVQLTTTKRVTVGWYDSSFEAHATYLNFKTQTI